MVSAAAGWEVEAAVPLAADVLGVAASAAAGVAADGWAPEAALVAAGAAVLGLAAGVAAFEDAAGALLEPSWLVLLRAPLLLVRVRVEAPERLPAALPAGRDAPELVLHAFKHQTASSAAVRVQFAWVVPWACSPGGPVCAARGPTGGTTRRLPGIAIAIALALHE